MRSRPAAWTASLRLKTANIVALTDNQTLLDVVRHRGVPMRPTLTIIYGSERTPSVEIGIQYPRWQVLTGSITSSSAQQGRHPDDSGLPAQHSTLPSPRPSASGSQPAASPRPSSTRRRDSVGRQSDVSATSSPRPPPSFISDQWRSRS